MSDLYDVVGQGIDEVCVLKGVNPPGSVLILSTSDQGGCLLVIKCNSNNDHMILPQFVSPDTKILDTSLRSDFGWSVHRRGYDFQVVDLKKYRGWFYLSSDHTVEELFTIIKEVYDRNTRRSSGFVRCPKT